VHDHSYLLVAILTTWIWKKKYVNNALQYLLQHCLSYGDRCIKFRGSQLRNMPVNSYRYVESITIITYIMLEAFKT